MNMHSVQEELEKKLKDLDFEMKELRDNESEDLELFKKMDQRMDELKNKQPTSLPPQLSIMMEEMKRREDMNIIDAKIGLLQEILKLLKDEKD